VVDGGGGGGGRWGGGSEQEEKRRDRAEVRKRRDTNAEVMEGQWTLSYLT
jgi:hypothetical protein